MPIDNPLLKHRAQPETDGAATKTDSVSKAQAESDARLNAAHDGIDAAIKNGDDKQLTSALIELSTALKADPALDFAIKKIGRGIFQNTEYYSHHGGICEKTGNSFRKTEERVNTQGPLSGRIGTVIKCSECDQELEFRGSYS